MTDSMASITALTGLLAPPRIGATREAWVVSPITFAVDRRIVDLAASELAVAPPIWIEREHGWPLDEHDLHRSKAAALRAALTTAHATRDAVADRIAQLEAERDQAVVDRRVIA